MTEFWRRVQALRGQVLETPTHRGRFTVLDVGDHGLELAVHAGGSYYLPRPALEAAAKLPDEDLIAARIRARGISESQPSYVAAIVRATRKPTEAQRPVGSDPMPTGGSKYDGFWSARLDALQALVDRAAHGEQAEMDASAITTLGNRASWSGNADVKEAIVVSAAMAHMTALARRVSASGIARAYPDKAFHFSMSSTGRLRVVARAGALGSRTPLDSGAAGQGDQATPARATALAAIRQPTDVQLTATDACAAVHRLFFDLPAYRTPHDVPFRDGLYVFYERRERSPHADGARIVRIGNHPRSDGRLVGRLKEHYLTRRNAKNGSVFRLLLGGALIRRDDPQSTCLLPGPGRGHWEAHMQLECDACAPYEERVTDFLCTECAFRCIRIPDRAERNRFEGLLVATVAACTRCRPSENWVGCFAWSPTVRRTGLWNREFVGGATLSGADLQRLAQLVAQTPAASRAAATDLSSTLLLIPCSASKAGWPDPHLPVKRVGELVSPEVCRLLEEGRQLAFARTHIDLATPAKPAIATYSGFPYATPGFRELLVSHLRRGLHCLIVSGGYGLVRPEEPIHVYEAHLQQTRGIWSERVPALLRDYVQRNGINRTFAVFSRTYSGVVPGDLTGDDWCAVESSVDSVDQGSAMRAVPRKVGTTLLRLMQSEYDPGYLR